jgi:hypothetical protein
MKNGPDMLRLHAQNCEPWRMVEEFPAPHTLGCMITILSALVSVLSLRICSRASPEHELSSPCDVSLLFAQRSGLMAAAAKSSRKVSWADCITSIAMRHRRTAFVRPSGALHGEPAARGQCAVHDPAPSSHLRVRRLRWCRGRHFGSRAYTDGSTHLIQISVLIKR